MTPYSQYIKVHIFSLNSSYDAHLTPFTHQGRNFTERINLSTEALFTHDTDCLAAVVPQQEISNRFLQNVVNYADTEAIGFALLLFIIVRIFLQKESWHRGFMIAFKTVGVFLNQNKILNANPVQLAWDINLRVFSLLATTALSAIIFQSLIAAEDSNEINTIDDLVKSNLPVYAPNYLRNQEIWTHLEYSQTHYCSITVTSKFNFRPSLRSKIQFTTSYEAISNYFDEQKFNFAFIYRKTTAEYIIMVANSMVQAGSRPRFRLMNEQIRKFFELIIIFHFIDLTFDL